MKQTAGAPDPRTIITPDAFTVAPELLGMPLAHPWRRAAAMLVDLVLVAILANAQAVFFAFAVGLFVFRLATRRRKTTTEPSTARRAARVGFGCLGAFTLVIASLAIWFTVTADPDTELGRVGGGEGRDIPITVGAIRDLVTAASVADSAEAAAAADRLVERLGEEDFEPEELRGLLDDMGEDLDSATAALVDQALERADASPGADSATAVDPDTLSVDSLLARYTLARSAATAWPWPYTARRWAKRSRAAWWQSGTRRSIAWRAAVNRCDRNSTGRKPRSRRSGNAASSPRSSRFSMTWGSVSAGRASISPSSSAGGGA
ncbi:MAG: hypothetical protein ACR2GQ_03300 [Gemmatimonadota bacterium]